MGNLIILLLRDTCIVSFMKNTAKNFVNMFPGALESSWIFVSSLFTKLLLIEKSSGSEKKNEAKKNYRPKMSISTEE